MYQPNHIIIKRVTSVLYYSAIFLYCFVIRVVALFNATAALWGAGRKNWRTNLKLACAKLSGKTVWIHCSSLGEFEQARPIVDGIKSECRGVSVVVSFFSPSGYTIRHNYKYADLVVYLPCDLPGNAAYFIKTLKPNLAVFVKYDLWYGYLKVLFQMNIPAILVSAIQHKALTGWSGALYKKICYRLLDKIYVQDELSMTNIRAAVNREVIVAGDTRIDSVIRFSGVTDHQLDHDMKRFVGDDSCLVCGSTWPADQDLLIPLIKDEIFKNWKAIIAPHEMKKDDLENLKKQFGEKAIFYSEFERYDQTHTVLIIDSIGHLSKIYRYATLAYIGGGFGNGIHNTLEPAAFSLPVIFGPKFKKFSEAVNLTKDKAFAPINNQNELFSTFIYYNKVENRKNAAEAIRAYMNSNKGASGLILHDIKLYYLGNEN